MIKGKPICWFALFLAPGIWGFNVQVLIFLGSQFMDMDD
jgi:hypothetical protein